MFDHVDLHRHDLQLFADFLANGVLAATAGAGQLVLGQFVNDFDTQQINRQRLVLAAVWRRRNDCKRSMNPTFKVTTCSRRGAPYFSTCGT